ncbi:PNO1 [Lepeophtheirus salmonis]|uniref:PNO1 n=1 Tax=Lepeophtheirus salmonis TaxID=72036 RepID=A0A7R8CT23_LEPSM|nr:PNO1 [Lepeophtheirus salmonis]CAF2922420.1 PNO1 [Lepeophtheirus salmonis]
MAAKRKITENEEDKAMEVQGEETTLPKFLVPPVKREKLSDGIELRKIPVPNNRYSPLKENWLKIFNPVVEILKLQIRFNLKTRNVEIRNSAETKDLNHLQKAADFVRAFIFGFEVEDALALLRLDDLFLDSFQVTDVKSLKGDHLSRAIGRIADSKIHLLGSYQNIQIAKRALCNLILGSPPSKVYGTLRSVSARSSERF